MKKFSTLVVLMLSLILFLPKAYGEQVLPNYPVLKPIVWNWANGDYMDKNTPEIKQQISNEFMNILCNEENDLEEYISDSKVSEKDKSKAFLKHMNNVNAVSKNLAQVIDWIICENEIPEPQSSINTTKKFYGITYNFQSAMLYDEGESYYSYSAKPIKLVDYPMIKIKFEIVGTESHARAHVDKEYFITKYTGKVSQDAINMYKTNQNLYTLNYEGN